MKSPSLSHLFLALARPVSSPNLISRRTMPSLVTASFCRRISQILTHVFRQCLVFFTSHGRKTYAKLFSTLTANIRSRRGSKVAINLPIFIDEKTPRPFVDPTIPWQRSIYPEDPGECNSLPIYCDRFNVSADRG